MNKNLLELNFSQLKKAWKRTYSYQYHDQRLQEYLENLNELFHQLETDIQKDLDASDIIISKQIIEFLFQNIEFIDSSTLNLIPFEIIKCLEISLSDWIGDFEKYIIVTSLRRNINSYSIQISSDEKIIKLIQVKYKIELKFRLIQLNIPKYLSRDYLTNVVLYHEIGHFIDLRLHISEMTYLIKANDIRTKKEYSKYFPPGISDKIIRRYLMEYFADLFAAQYIGESSNYYLKYVDHQSKFYPSHPATIVRTEAVIDFVKGIDNPLVNIFNDILIKSGLDKFINRYRKINENDLLELMPINVQNDAELHYLYILGWDVWLNRRNELVEKNKMNFDLNYSQLYLILNSLIEKSIGNYIIRNDWKISKT